MKKALLIVAIFTLTGILSVSTYSVVKANITVVTDDPPKTKEVTKETTKTSETTATKETKTTKADCSKDCTKSCCKKDEAKPCCSKDKKK